MEEKLAAVAAAAGMDSVVAVKLDWILAGPNDRAYVLCTAADCGPGSERQCTIFTLLDVPRMKREAPCGKYQKQLL
jgi:hypothetical protein